MMAWIVSAFLLFLKMMVTRAGSCFQDTLKLDLVTEWQSQCFGFKDSLYTWSEAARACQRMDANLIRMTGPEVQVMMADKIAKMHSGRHEIVSFWLGARDEKKTNEWRWENNDALEWTSWTAGPHSGTCVIYDGYLAGWRKTNCESFDATVCQKDLPPQSYTTEKQTTAVSSIGDSPSTDATLVPEETSGIPTSALPVNDLAQRLVRKNTNKQQYQRLRYFSVMPGKHLLSVPLVSTKAWSFTSCSAQCTVEDMCVLANFDLLHRTCNLYNTMSALKQGFESTNAWYLMVAKEKIVPDMNSH